MKTNRAALGASVLLLIFIGVCVWLVFQYVASEEKRDLQNWQERLGLMAEAQKRSVERWLSKQTEALQTLADNPLVQLYVSELSRFDAGGMNEAQLGQLHHLKNLINASARSAGVFTPLKTISSNSAQTVNDGLALYNHDGMLLSTRYFPAQDAFVEAFAQRALAQKKRRISKIYSNPAGQARFVIAVPVSSVQSVG
ncbi:MAG TPA: hypothetical protein ENJ64_04310, partial [Thiotrichales bacterium]|nr:hypothetical protein [Thiotrichales bacterium]